MSHFLLYMDTNFIRLVFFFIFLLFFLQKIKKYGIKWCKVYESGVKWKEGVKMFVGSYECSVDNKGRLTLPAKFRDKLNGKPFYLVLGLEGQIEIYTESKWEATMEELDSFDAFDEDANAYKMFFFNNAQEGELDTQGRLNINFYKSKINFEKKVTVVGMRNVIAIWEIETHKKKDLDLNTVKNISKKIFKNRQE